MKRPGPLPTLLAGLLLARQAAGTAPGADAAALVGRVAFLVAVPVAMHCPYALGYQTYEVRILWCSLPGCFFFGVFSAKMLLLRSERLAGCCRSSVDWCSPRSRSAGRRPRSGSSARSE